VTAADGVAGVLRSAAVGRLSGAQNGTFELARVSVVCAVLPLAGPKDLGRD